MTFDYIVEGKTYLNKTFQQCCIGIEDDKIISIKKILTGAKKKTFPKHLILPAGIDIDVHFRDPGFLHKETFQTGSKAAAFGGISCVFDMPNTQPQTVKKNEIISKIKNASQNSVIDFGIYAGITNENINNLKDFSSIVPGFKIFLGHSTHSLSFSKTKLSFLFKILKEISKPVLFHAEDEECLITNKRNETNLTDHHNNRPPSCEVLAINNILNYAPFPCPVHICHVTSKEALQLLQTRKNNSSIGVTPHHCLLDIDNITPKYQTLFKVNPPLRPNIHRKILYQSLTKGHISILESDHAPHTLKEKTQPFSQAPSGLPGVETMYPLFLSLAYQQKISFPQVFSLLCEQPATLLKLPKGRIKERYDADFIVVDIKKQNTITGALLHSKSEYSPFENFPAIFPKHVYLRGRPVIEESNLTIKPGYGNHVINN